MTQLASQAIVDAFNQQAGNEMGASNQYIAIASYFAEENLDQLSQFFFKQSEEEREHSLKFVHFILDTGGHVDLPEITKPPHRF
ncbi:MAG: ferritin-like domain-containing protein, partial [Acidobacteriota bacterium]